MSVSDRDAIVKWLTALTKNGARTVGISRAMALRIIDLLGDAGRD